MVIDNSRLQDLIDRCLREHDRYNIGTYKEKTQHLILKYYFEDCNDFHEVPVGKFIADILREDDIIEIQTSGFRALRSKLEVFLSLGYKVTVVYPIHSKKNICWLDPETGESTEGSFRNYPKAQYKLISELLHITEIFPLLTIRCVFLTATEVRLLDGYGADRKKRATKKDTVPMEIISAVDISSKEDIIDFLPFKKGDKVTNAEISKLLGLKRRNLWCAVRFLEILEIIEKTDKIGNAFIYTVK